MLHSLKLQFSPSAQKSVLSSDERLTEIDASLKLLLRTFPEVQARVEENERAWTALSTSVRGMGAACRSAAAVPVSATEQRPESSALASALQRGADALVGVGERLPCPRTSGAHRALRALNESVRALRARFDNALRALRDREYYAHKVGVIVAAEARRPGAPTERDSARRLRNENKLTQSRADLALHTDRLERDLQSVLRQKDQVLAGSMRAFVELQIECLDSVQIAPVLDDIPAEVEDPLLKCASSVDSDGKPRIGALNRGVLQSHPSTKTSFSGRSESSASRGFLTPVASSGPSGDSEETYYNMM